MNKRTILNRRRPGPKPNAKYATDAFPRSFVGVPYKPTAPLVNRPMRSGPTNNTLPVAPQTLRQRKQTGRKKSTAAVTGAGGQNRSVAVGKRAAPTTPSTTRKALTRGQSRRRERVAERTVAQQQRAARRSANQAKRTARKTANQAKRATRMARRTR